MGAFREMSYLQTIKSEGKSLPNELPVDIYRRILFSTSVELHL